MINIINCVQTNEQYQIWQEHLMNRISNIK